MNNSQVTSPLWVAFGATVLVLGGCVTAKQEPVMEVEVATPVVVIVDSDGDGVPDDQDRCPGTPAGTIVDESGCELDSDGDGVVDSQDACPNTLAGANVDAKGCEIIYSLPDAQFETNSARLSASAVSNLNDALKVMRTLGDRQYEIAGHTDSRGTEQYNMGLGESRAQSVWQFFVSKGMDPGQLSVISYGESSPIASNDTEEGMALNRRVEVVDITQ